MSVQIEMQVEALVNQISGFHQLEVMGPPERIGDRLKELVKKMLANLENIDPDEAAALIAQATTMATAFASGNFIGGFLAFLEFVRMYRKAIKPEPGPAPAVA